MTEVFKEKSNQGCKKVSKGNRTFLIYDGIVTNPEIVEDAKRIKKLLADAVIEGVRSSALLKAMDGGLLRIDRDKIPDSNIRTEVKYIGPKRLPIIVVVDETKIRIEEEKAWNIRNFFRKR